MAAIPNKIVIGDLDNPILEFDNNTLVEVNSDTSVALVGEELYIDQFAATVDYYVQVPYVFKPTDYDGFMSSGSKVICTRKNYDIRLLPYGTKITYYADGNVAGVFYVQRVERLQRELYKITAISAIGLLDKQYHKGDIYTGQYFQDVIQDIIGNDYDYIIDGVVAIQRVYGWLPYDTKRNNLHQLLMAYGVEIILGDSGAMFLTFPSTEQVAQIPASRVFTGGKVIYDEPASRIEVFEHSYHYDPAVTPVSLFDNSADEFVTDALVTFDEPIYPASLASDTLTIGATGTNYAVVSGVGILTGIPYVHNVRILTKDNANAPVEKIVSVQDATLVTFVSADNVLARLGEYYFNATRVEQDIVAITERPGRLYSTENAFNELITGYISKMTKSVTSIARATCRFIQNYTPTGSGQSYSERVLIPLGNGASQTWQIPSAVFEKENPVIRITLIGKGQSGENGKDGEKPPYVSDKTPNGGAGGVGGKGGIGGNIFTATILATGLTELNFSNSGVDSVMTSLYYNYSSADGSPNQYGYYDLMTTDVFAQPGKDGVDGGAGGKGDYYTHTTSTPSTAEPGGDVSYDGVTYHGGAAGVRGSTNGSNLGISPNITVYISGRGGGGAAVGNDGNAPVTRSYQYVGTGGVGADADAPDATSNMYGAGGNGGHGGGGGGAGAVREYWNHEYKTIISMDGTAGGAGGKGSAGTAGAYGCAIIYY